MPDMCYRRSIRVLLIPTLLVAAVCAGCQKAANAPSNSSSQTANAATPESAQAHAIETEIVALQPIAGAILATGKILVTEDRVANIGPVHGGRLVRLYARTKVLYEKTITPGKNLQAAEHDLEVAKASAESSVAGTRSALTAARRHLLILGLKQSDIDALKNKPDSPVIFSLTSPITGIVVERNATIGATVGSDANVFKIIDLSRVWIDANVFEKDLERVKRGQEVKVAVTAFPGSSFSGRVILINSVVDPETRSVKVRTEVPNPDGRLKPDMFANVQIITDQHRASISIPQSAVLKDGEKTVVFVVDRNGYKKRQVTAGIQSSDRVEIIDGLNAGDRVVVKGNYLLLQQSKPEQ